MKNNISSFSRLTFDVPKEIHKKLKVFAALQGKSIRDVMIDLITEAFDKININNLKF